MSGLGNKTILPAGDQWEETKAGRRHIARQALAARGDIHPIHMNGDQLAGALQAIIHGLDDELAGVEKDAIREAATRLKTGEALI